MLTVTCPECLTRIGAPARAARPAVFCPRCEAAVPIPGRVGARAGVDRSKRTRREDTLEESVRYFRVLLWLACALGQVALVWCLTSVRQPSAAAACFHAFALFAATWSIDAAARLALPKR
jgi:hypothetical protein